MVPVSDSGGGVTENSPPTRLDCEPNLLILSPGMSPPLQPPPLPPSEIETDTNDTMSMNNCEPPLVVLQTPPPLPPRQYTAPPQTPPTPLQTTPPRETTPPQQTPPPPREITPPQQTTPPMKIAKQNQNCEPEWDSTFSRVLAEYEKTMSGYIQQIDELKEKLEAADDEKLKIIRERDLALEDLRNVESAFSDVHGKYERAKGLLENCRRNEEILKRRDQEMTEKIAHRDGRIQTLKEKLQSTLEQMHTNYEGRLKEMETEASRQRVLIRKADLKVETLQNDVEHKSREISKLSGLCDELINGGVH